MTNTERVAYIRGLAEGLELDGTKKEVKIINAMIDLLDDLAMSVAEIEENCDDIADQLDAVDEDLGSMENDFYGDDEEEDDECYYEVTCPKCNETICLSEDIIADGQMQCPNCGEQLDFDMEDFCDQECDCGCHGEK